MRRRSNARKRALLLLRESAAALRAASHPVSVSGGPLDEEGYRWPIVIIRAGASVNAGPSGKKLYYTPEALRSAIAVFSGAKSYADHPTRSQEQDLPERSVRDVVGFVSDVAFDESSGELRGVWNVVDDGLRSKIRAAHKLGKPDLVGFSIHAAGATEVGARDGQEFELVTSIASAGMRSVDVVTEPAAGGRFLTRLAACVQSSEGVPLMTIAELRAQKPAFAAALAKLPLEEAISMLKEIGADEALIAEWKASAGQAEETPAEKPAEEKQPEPAMAMAASLRESVAAVNRQLARLETATLLAESGLDSATQADLRPSLESAADTDARKALVEARRSYLAKLSEGGAFPSGTVRGTVTGGADPHEKYAVAIDGWMSGHDEKLPDGTIVPRFRTLREAVECHPRHQGRHVRLYPLDIFRECARGRVHAGYRGGELGSYALRESGVVRLTEANGTMLRESVTTSGFAEVWADRAYKRMMKTYSSSNDVKELEAWASDKEELPDFKTHRVIRLGEYAAPGSVAEGGTYLSASTPADNEEATSLTKYGFIEDVTMEALLGEDGKRLRTLPDRMIAAVLRLERQTIINRITTTNPTLNSDSITLYHASHSNTGTTALSVSELAVIERAMMQQTSLTAAEQLGTINRPWGIIIPPELLQLMTRINAPSDAYTVAMNTDTNTVLDPHMWKGRFKILVGDHFTDANDYFVQADPAKMPTFQISRLQGVSQPEFTTQDAADSPSMFDTDKIKWKVVTYLGVEPLDFRSFYREVVA